MWMKIDDRMHAHRKTRALTRSHTDKSRDAAPMGLWVLAGSWASQNATDGWVPASELDRWDDDWEPLARRLVRSGYWWPEEHDGEPGYGFNDWQEWNSPAASESGVFGNHVRWHVKKGVVKPDCEHCPTEPEGPEEPEFTSGPSGASRPDIAPDDRPDIGSGIAPNRLPVPVPTRPDPDPENKPRPKGEETEPPERFEEFWDTYANKVGRKKSETAYRAALKKPGVTADRLIAAAASYIAWQVREGKHPRYTKNPTSWLNGEHWTDERTAQPAPLTNTQRHLQLAQKLAQEQGNYAIGELT
jgi:hypothetical protein